MKSYSLMIFLHIVSDNMGTGECFHVQLLKKLYNRSSCIAGNSFLTLLRLTSYLYQDFQGYYQFLG